MSVLSSLYHLSPLLLHELHALKALLCFERNSVVSLLIAFTPTYYQMSNMIYYSGWPSVRLQKGKWIMLKCYQRQHNSHYDSSYKALTTDWKLLIEWCIWIYVTHVHREWCYGWPFGNHKRVNYDDTCSIYYVQIIICLCKSCLSQVFGSNSLSLHVHSKQKWIWSIIINIHPYTWRLMLGVNILQNIVARTTGVQYLKKAVLLQFPWRILYHWFYSSLDSI